ncbi:unnamed protein product, partial [Symbiodinium microadriaticum]
AIKKIQELFPEAKVQSDGKRQLAVTGSQQIQDQVAKLLRGGTARNTVVMPGEKRYTLKVEQLPLGPVLDALEKQLGKEFDVPEGMEEELKQRISFDVNAVDLAALLEATCPWGRVAFVVLYCYVPAKQHLAAVLFQLFAECVSGEWFHEVVGNTCLNGFHDARLFCFGRHHHDFDIRIDLADLLNHFQAAFAWHVPIGQYEIELARLEHLDRFFTVSCFNSVWHADSLKGTENDLSHCAGVVGDKYAYSHDSFSSC